MHDEPQRAARRAEGRSHGPQRQLAPGSANRCQGQPHLGNRILQARRQGYEPAALPAQCLQSVKNLMVAQKIEPSAHAPSRDSSASQAVDRKKQTQPAEDERYPDRMRDQLAQAADSLTGAFSLDGFEAGRESLT